MIDLQNKKIDLDFFHSVLKAVKDYPNNYLDIIDSFSKNQFLSKTRLIDLICSQNILNKNTEIVIFGCWYGSILIPVLSSKVRKISAIDLNEEVILIAKNRFFKKQSNVDYIIDDVFTKNLERYNRTNLIINTSCEHMKSMRVWPFWKHIKSGTYFAFQSNNMFNIEGHINCVDSMEEFKTQMPLNSNILLEDVISDDRGERYTVIGQIT